MSLAVCLITLGDLFLNSLESHSNKLNRVFLQFLTRPLFLPTFGATNKPKKSLGPRD